MSVRDGERLDAIKTALDAILAAQTAGNTGDAAIDGVLAVTPHNTNTFTKGRAIIVNCTVAGDVKVGFSDGSTMTLQVAVGLSVFPLACNQVFLTGTTATATYAKPAN